MLVLDLDGTLTTSEKKITPQTKEALIKLQKMGKYVVLASGRPTYGIIPLVKELELDTHGNYILAFNGGSIINCSTNQIVYNKVVPKEYISEIYDFVKGTGADLITYTDSEILSAFYPSEYTDKEAFINKMPVKQLDNFVEAIDFPINKLLITGDPDLLANMRDQLKRKYHSALNIYCSEPYFLEVMPANIDKAYSLQKLLNSLGLTAEQMICCGDGQNDLTMIEAAGLGVAMANAQSVVLNQADYITKSNDEDGVLHVIETYMF